MRREAASTGVLAGAGVALLWVVPALAVLLLIGAAMRAAILGLFVLLRRLRDPALGPPPSD